MKSTLIQIYLIQSSLNLAALEIGRQRHAGEAAATALLGVATGPAEQVAGVTQPPPCGGWLAGRFADLRRPRRLSFHDGFAEAKP